MQKIMFNDRYGLTDLVLSGKKTQTRRIVPKEVFTLDWDTRQSSEGGTLELVIADSFGSYHNVIDTIYNKYKNNEVVAVAQSYYSAKVVGDTTVDYPLIFDDGDAGYYNKMFVKAKLMPHAIKITNIRVERLQDISDEDCLAEGIEKMIVGCEYYCYSFLSPNPNKIWEDFKSPRQAYATLIDKVNGKGTWASNPYVFVYDFELVK